ncbi:ERBB-3 BINDING PROTEIN 1-like protein [Cinnamomum micranthum f. kanehirae]|uniref:ERBB-3 BINDING PROTEIN 1-like protein n=1 Tax=Cinnamomum micranthum f. kanehirae TaxID=337451 RepID=A0A3S3NLL9_9MAGN|nr:ERBB-3 BINDING PROTEIN 1-like protein [Cinnamomum micranthum f. kanehirae]
MEESWRNSRREKRIKNKEVTEAIQKVAAAYDCKIVEGVLSHQLKQFVIDGNKVILSVTNPEMRVDDAEFEENEVYAIDIVTSTGDGKPRLLDEKQTTIYKRAVDKNYHLKMKSSRFIFSEINQKFPIMPFTARALEEKRARLGLVECVNHDLLQPYPVLHEKPAIGSGLSMPLMTVIIGQLINSFAGSNSNNIVHQITKVVMKSVYLAIYSAVLSFIQFGVPCTWKLFALAPNNRACSRMDLTAIHQILVMTHYRDDERTNELSFQEWTQQMRDTLEARKRGDFAFCDRYFKTAIDCYTQEMGHLKLRNDKDAALRDAMAAQCVYLEWPTAFYMLAIALAKLEMPKDAAEMLNEAAGLEKKRQRGGRGS